MRKYLLAALLAFFLLSCEALPGLKTTRETKAPPPAKERDFGYDETPSTAEMEAAEKARTDALNQRIKEMDRRVPPRPDTVLPPDIHASEKPKETKPEKPVEPKKVEEPAKPAPVARVAASVTGVIEALEARSDLSADEQFQLEVLRALAGSKDRATLVPQLYKGADKPLSPAWHTILTALDSCALGKADETLARLREAEEMLREVSSVRIQSAVFCDRIDGLGNYVPRKSTTFTRGEEALIYFEVADFKCAKKGEQWEYRLSVEAALLDTAGRVAAKLKSENAAQAARSSLSSQFYSLKFAVPNDVYRGDYIVRITATDELKKQLAEESLKIEVK
jgi:hypothetical protein